MERGELYECLTMFYAAVRRQDGTEFKVSSLKAIHAAIDRYLRPAASEQQAMVDSQRLSLPKI